ncbi:MAG: S49 family peptidase, partial [Nitratireductor sp.]|nr:S49 family peptidase [Nitratireductor sp.]
IDGFGHMSTVMKERYGPKTKLQLMQARRNLLGRPVPAVGVQATGLASGLGSEIAAVLPSSLAEAAEERALWARYGL